MRTALLLLLLAASLPLAWAHSPAGTPDPACEDGSLHDYVAAGRQGLEGQYHTLSPGRPVLDGSQGGSDCAGGDGHAEFGAGLVVLAVESGDGATSGSLACLGAAGHHTALVHALDVAGHGPSFSVGADRSHVPPASGPDCGDGIVSPCNDSVTSPLPEPMKTVVDTINALIVKLFEPIEDVAGPVGCNRADRIVTVEGVPGGPSWVAVPFPPGADGSYVVFPEQLRGFQDPVAGHVWTA